jgi:hypothetical protein
MLLAVSGQHLVKTAQGTFIEQVAYEQSIARLESSNTDFTRSLDAIGLVARYSKQFDPSEEKTTRDQLVADLALGRNLAASPPTSGTIDPEDGPAAVAAAALEARFRNEFDVPDDDLAWAAAFLVAVIKTLADHGESEVHQSAFRCGAARAAARALPLLLLPAARGLREGLLVGNNGGIARCTEWIVTHGANETRLFFARGFDPLWQTPCSNDGDECHHITALAVIEDAGRDTIVGSWDPAEQRNRLFHLDGSVALQLQNADQNRIYVPRLNATIHGAAGAAASGVCCCRSGAFALLAAALCAHRRGKSSRNGGYSNEHTDAAVAARAILEIVATGNHSLLFEQIDDYADNSMLLSEFLDALVASGEETQRRATAAREVWPAVMERVIELIRSDSCQIDRHYFGLTPLAAVIPRPSHEARFLYREYEAGAILWGDPVALSPGIKRWLPLAAGLSEPLDALLHFLDRIPIEQQALLGLPWVEQLVMGGPSQIANRSSLLPNWLGLIRTHARSRPLIELWHRIVDALIVAGDGRIAAYAD